MKKILVAGAGHGGLVSAAKLAEKGYDVSVYEKLKREKLGHPWDDMVNTDTFEVAGINNFDINDAVLHDSITLIPPSKKSPIEIKFSPDKRNYEIERKVIYKYLLDHAEAKGVKLFFESEAKLLLKDEKVAGLTVNGKDVYGDLVIDSSGGKSNILQALPASYGIKYDFRDGSIFYTYRGRFEADLTKKINFENSFAMYLIFGGLRGIAWYKIVNGLSDVLIGSVDPLTEEIVKKTLDEMKNTEPSFTGKLVSGGTFNIIPFGPPIEQMTGDNYAVLGDASCMAVPINGNGISNAVYAGVMLAKAIINADAKGLKQGYLKSELLPYQKEFTLKYGAKMYEIATLKDFLLNINPTSIDFFFDKKVISESDMQSAMFGEQMKMSLPEMIKRLFRGASNLPALLGLANTLEKAKKARKSAENEASRM